MESEATEGLVDTSKSTWLVFYFRIVCGCLSFEDGDLVGLKRVSSESVPHCFRLGLLQTIKRALQSLHQGTSSVPAKGAPMIPKSAALSASPIFPAVSDRSDSFLNAFSTSKVGGWGECWEAGGGGPTHVEQNRSARPKAVCT